MSAPRLPVPIDVDPLERMLHRCHRDELVPLARVLGIKAEQLGLGSLANAVARQLRRAGGHELANIALRRGEGPPYVAILGDLARARGVPPGSAEEMELGLVRTTFAERWNHLPPSERRRVWAELGVAGEPPATGRDALAGANAQLGRSVGYALAQVARLADRPSAVATAGLVVGLLLRPLLAVFGPLWAWWKLRPDEALVLSAILEVARLRQIVLHRVTIGVVGSPSTGKDAAIRALFGIDSGNVSPIAGSTREVTIHQLPTSTALFLVNTPGLGDVVEQVTEQARQVLDHIDVYLYVVNAEGGVQKRELEDYRRCLATGKPVLAVVNKIDVLRPNDRDRYLADAREKLGAPSEDFLPVAFDPLPELSPAPIGVEAVHAWLSGKLAALGKDPAELPPLGVSSSP